MVIPHYSRRFNESKPNSNNEESMPQQNYKNSGSQKDFKKVDSFSSSASCQDIPLLLPQEPVGPAPDNSVKCAGTTQKPPLFPSLLERKKAELSAHALGLPMKTFVAELGSPDLDKELIFDMGMPLGSDGEDEWWENQERGYPMASELELGQVGPRSSCHCQVLPFTFDNLGLE
jgi:phospholipase D1/2